MIAQRIRAMAPPHWLALHGVILIVWMVLFYMAVPNDLRASAPLFGLDFLPSLYVILPDAGGYTRMEGMWALVGRSAEICQIDWHGPK